MANPQYTVLIADGDRVPQMTIKIAEEGDRAQMTMRVAEEGDQPQLTVKIAEEGDRAQMTVVLDGYETDECVTVALEASATWLASAHGIADPVNYTFRQVSGESDTLRIQRFGGTWTEAGLLQSTPFTVAGHEDLRIVNDADAASFEYCPPA